MPELEQFMDEILHDVAELMHDLFDLGYTEDGEVGQKANDIRQKLILERVVNRPGD